jgi:hypothetical protein
MVMRYLINFLLLIAWVWGMSLANGFWSTFVAAVLPFWAWYLVIERITEMLR